MVSGTESCACTGTAVQINNRIIAVVKAGQLGRNLFRIRARIAKIILQPLGESALLYPAKFFCCATTATSIEKLTDAKCMNQMPMGEEKVLAIGRMRQRLK